VASALKQHFKTKEPLGELVVFWMREIGNKYPKRGFGESFAKWLKVKNPRPYRSYGNGAAMRISPVADYAKTIKEAVELSKEITEVTHSHPEGLKGAEAVAVVCYLLKHGKSKDDVREYVNKHYYKLDFTIDEIRPYYPYSETCERTVPEAIECFLESSSFEDAIRNAISLGGDSDTLASITGAIAQYFYGTPFDIGAKALSYLDDYTYNIYTSLNIHEFALEGQLIGGIKKGELWEDDDVYFKVGNLFYPYMNKELSLNYPIPSLDSIHNVGTSVTLIKDTDNVPNSIKDTVFDTIKKDYYQYLNKERNRYKF
jgi:hypothetical protein